MKFNRNFIINLLVIAINQLPNARGVKISESELNNFKYGAKEFTMAIIGDTGYTKEASQVMNLASFDALLHLGDYDYKCEPDSYFTKILGSNRKYKFFGILGNHEDAGECGESKYHRYVSNINYQMKKNTGTSCVFSKYKTMWSCVYNNVRIVGLSPSISKEESRSSQLAFLKKYLSESSEDWKICAWHYYDDYYHTGKYQKNKNYVSGDGENFYDYCKNQGAIIFSAHDHVYARTHVMSKFSKPVIDTYDYDSPSNIVQIRKGATLNILDAVGGWEVYDEAGKHKNFSHWIKKYARGSNGENAKKYGGLFCKFNVGGNNKKSYCEFKRINSSTSVFDSFTIYRNNDPKNIAYDKIDSRFLSEKIAAYQAKKSGSSSGSGSTTTTTNNNNPTIKTSTNDRCGSSYGKCPSGKCCSKYGWCSTSNDHCDVDKGCQTKYGILITTSIPYSSSNRCGSSYGKCRNNECCSRYGWCSNSSSHCGSGCQPLYGRCY
ncbi:Metallo-dependent phosphatase [Piromyces finnis]|uniref:Metallo-dependent phosphatase n=1 Tax=Piromyces finnis TaxID=1754191 RepID=A0A1Y1VJZ4_9FUNG|nr:Metallo-dependent phosphatase [Piromyces finnis]|eukprot:ORX57688.1 Metallo-dependent phosphatase [Piromyces finnis]